MPVPIGQQVRYAAPHTSGERVRSGHVEQVIPVVGEHGRMREHTYRVRPDGTDHAEYVAEARVLGVLHQERST